VDEPDPRWQGIIAVGEFLDKEQQSVWEFIERWRVYPDDDLRIAIATVLLEHLLEMHFESFFPRVQQLVVRTARLPSRLACVEVRAIGDAR
jgi:hypothetical protein